jgi:hypothetical protein
MDILYILKERFEEIKALMLKVSDGPQSDIPKPLKEQLSKKIRVLSRLQSEYIYPEIRGVNPSLDSILSQSIHDLEHVESLLDTPSPWDGAKLQSLLDSIKEYIIHEETLLMPKLRITMRTEDREDLGQVVVDAEEELQKTSFDEARPTGSKSGTLARNRGGKLEKGERVVQRLP